MTDDRPDPAAAGPPGATADAERVARLEAAVAGLARQVAALERRLDGRAPERPAPAATAHGTAATAAGDAWSRLAHRVGAATHRHQAPHATRDTRDTRDTPGIGAGRGDTPAGRGGGRSLDLESLVGRYGTMLLGGLAILLGVGAFLRWAIERVTLGPEMRVALGALAAVLLGALGLWLRARPSAAQRRFGSVLLAIALAVVHVVAWGAGPALGVVPSGVALAIAAAASAALAVVAWRGVEQPLFVVGIGGALLAPFVTSAESGDPAMLLAYGLMVLSAAIVALRDRAWPWAVRVCTSGVLAYVGVALDASWAGGIGDAPLLRRIGPAVFVLACAWVALLWGGRQHRSSLARLFLLILALPIAVRGSASTAERPYLDLLLLAGAGIVTLYVALRLHGVRQPQRSTSALLQPLVLLLAALPSVPPPLDGWSAAVSLAVAALALLAAVEGGLLRALSGDAPQAPPAPHAPDAPAPATAAVTDAVAGATPERDLLGVTLWHAHLLVAALASAFAIAIGLGDEQPVAAAAALALHAAGVALLARRAHAGVVLVAPILGLLFASAWTLEQLGARPAYEYAPFLTPPSLAALVVVAAWYVCGHVFAAMLSGPATGPVERAIVRALGPAALFLWGREELSRAFSPDLSQFLLIAYFATVGVLLILFGRRRGLPGGRRIGLALAVYAALLAIAEASDFANVGLRVGSYLLVGGFLLAVAYWYRAAGEESRDDVPEATDVPVVTRDA